MRRLQAIHAAAVLVALLAASSARAAADTQVAADWPAIDGLVAVDLLTPEKLKEPIVIDLATGGGADKCPGHAWTGQAIYLIPGGEELVYWGTGIYCAPIGYGRVQYSDGRTYTGQVNSFLASASATLTEKQFRPAVRHGNGKLERKGGQPMVGNFQRGALASDRSKDPAFLNAMNAAEASLPDRFAPMMTSAVAAFTALPASAPVAEAAPAAAAASGMKISDSVAAVGAQAVAQMTTSTPPATPAPTGGSLFTAAGVAATGASAAGTSGAGLGSYSGSGALALPAPLPSQFVDFVNMMGFGAPSEQAVAEAKQLPKEVNLKTRNNGIFYGAACPKAGFLGTKHWRGRVVFTETYSGRIVYEGVGLGCGPVGPGRVEFEDGSVYEGQVSTFGMSQMNPIGNFEPAVPSGPGRFTFPDGTVVEGTWSRGELNGGPITVTKRGGQPQAFTTGSLAALRAGGAIGPAAPGGAGPSNSTLDSVAAAAAASMLSGKAPVGATATKLSADAPVAATPFTPSAAQPFAPAGSGGLPFTPAGAAGAVAAGGPGKAGPQPMLGNSGKYLCPWTEDGVVAPWVDKAIKARMGGAIGGMVGAEAGKKMFENIPMFGGMIGKAAGDKIGREAAIKMAGGWEYIRANTDQSFDNVHEYVAWMKANYKGTEHYNNVVAAIKELYPELKTMQF